LKYKAEAVRIVRLWMDDPGRALNDEVFAAVIRLLTFEVSLDAVSLYPFVIVSILTRTHSVIGGQKPNGEYTVPGCST